MFFKRKKPIETFFHCVCIVLCETLKGWENSQQPCKPHSILLLMIISGKRFVVICPFCFIEENPQNQRRIAKIKEMAKQVFCRETNQRNHEERRTRPPTPPKPVSYSVRLLLQFEVKLATGRRRGGGIGKLMITFTTTKVIMLILNR